MDVFARLADAVRQQNEEGELPDFIVPLLMKIALNPAGFVGREELIETLAKYVEDYETFSNVCCEKIGYSLEDIHRTLDKLKVGY